MNQEEAREKFGCTVEGQEGEEQWQIDHNKLRGMFLKYSREVPYLEGTAEWPDAEEWVDHFWSWVKGSLGVGYKGVLQCKKPSPSGKFDRLGKSEAVRVANKYYDSHREFRENMNMMWHSVDKIEGLVESDEEYIETLEGMGNTDILRTFFNIYEKRDGAVIGKRQSPNVRAYKYHIKQWVFETETIMTHEPEPTAKALVECWIDWMGQEILSLKKPIVETEPEEAVGGIAIPDEEDIVDWCRELWKDSDKFKKSVTKKWNRDVHSGEDSTPDAREITDLRKGIDTSGKEKQGQQGLADYEM